MHQRITPTADSHAPRLARRLRMASEPGLGGGRGDAHLGEHHAATRCAEAGGNEASKGAPLAGGPPPGPKGRSASEGSPRRLGWLRATPVRTFGSPASPRSPARRPVAGADLLEELPGPPQLHAVDALLDRRADDQLRAAWHHLAAGIDRYLAARDLACDDGTPLLLPHPGTSAHALHGLCHDLDALLAERGRLCTLLRARPPSLEHAALGPLLGQVARFIRAEQVRLLRCAARAARG